MTALLPIRQVGTPCPKCGSYYRRGDYCNVKKCGTYAPVALEPVDRFSMAGREPTGQTWSKKLHRYLRHNEQPV